MLCSGNWSIKCCAFLIFLSFNPVFSYQNDFGLIEKIIYRIDLLVNFFNNFSTEANLDGIFGVHLSGEQLDALLQKINETCPNLNPKLNLEINAVRNLKTKMITIRDTAVPHIAQTYSDYFKEVGFLLQKKMWYVIHHDRSTKKFWLFPSTDNDTLDEPFSDKCIHELLLKNCQPTTTCWKYMTELGKTEYYITHELLYLQIGQQLGCVKELNKMTNTEYRISLNTLIQIYCTNILREAQQIASSGFAQEYHDLFMEQIGLCGYSGFYEFLQVNWINKILEWQQPNGCFGESKRRFKRYERTMSYGCSSHKSAVALLALQQFLSHLLKHLLASNCTNWE